MSNTVEYDILVEVLDAVKDLKKLQTQTKKTKEGLDNTKKKVESSLRANLVQHSQASRVLLIV